MFASMKNKIKEETGSDVFLKTNVSTRNSRSSRSSINSMASIDDLSTIEQKDAEINALAIQCNTFQVEINDLKQKLQLLTTEKQNLESANLLLEESVRVTQDQKNILYDEQDKIQNLQLQEITKLKNLLVFREQEAVDRLSKEKSNQVLIENMKTQLHRLKNVETMLEDSQDELNQLRHSSQIEKNSLTINLAAEREENRHLKEKLQVLEDTKINLLNNSTDAQIKCLLQERKLLTQRLEEAHLHLSDVKSNWSGQNLSLETQVSRLSRQVAEETTEKHKSIELSDGLLKKINNLENDLELINVDLKERDSKIKLLSEEIEDLSAALKEARQQNEEESKILKNQIVQHDMERSREREQTSDAEHRISNLIISSESAAKLLQEEIDSLKLEIYNLNDIIEKEKEEKLSVLIKNAEISQCAEILKQKLRHECVEVNDLQDKITMLENESKINQQKYVELKLANEELSHLICKQKDKLNKIDSLNSELTDKNKVIKILNQRLDDMKKTLQQEIKNSNNNGLVMNNNNNSNNNYKSNNTFHKTIPRDNNNITAINEKSSIIMDEVNFSYLKHVIIKFLTSREVEAKHLICAVSTLLQLSKDEENLLRDTLNYKMSWFASKPINHHIVKKIIPRS